jgi:recombination DNA repair RAD52 pathway protein
VNTCIKSANQDLFSFVKVDQLDSGRFNVGIAAVVRITLRDGAFHEVPVM